MRISDWSSDVCSSDLLAESDALGATATGTLRVTNSAERGGLIAGDLTIPEARYKIIRQGAADVPELQGVRRKGAPPQQESAQGGVPSRFRLRINVKRSEEHTSELQSLMRISYAVFCLKNKKNNNQKHKQQQTGHILLLTHTNTQ